MFPIEIDRVVDLLGLERDPKGGSGTSYRVRCPFCSNENRYYMHIDRERNVYHCFHCGGDHAGGGALALYGRAALGLDLIPGGKEVGGNGHYIYAKLAERLGMKQGVPPVEQKKQVARAKEPPRNTRAPDEKLHQAYAAVLDFSAFALSRQHKENLKKRGLDEASIVRNGYRSIPESCDWLDGFPEVCQRYDTLGLDQEAVTFPSLRRQTRQQRTAGFVVASELVQKGFSLSGVPGFYQLRGNWLFRLEPGMLIPTRNQKGEIVGLQARKDAGDLRYMTVSSKSLPEGVTEGISRIHFPLLNPPLSPKTKIHIIEGPLKADVTACLLKDPSAYLVAVQGVNNTKELPAFFQAAKAEGATQAFNCYDMDKLTNPHVAKACRALRQMAKDYGIQTRMKLWDEDYAKQKWFELYGLCQYHKIPVPRRSQNVFFAVRDMAKVLHQKGIQHSLYLAKTGIKKKYWSDETKGIDDFLLTKADFLRD